MNFLIPAFFGAAALLGIPVVLHLLKLQPRKRIPFPSLRFLGLDALRDSRRQSLRRWIVLLLRCLAILLIIAAFARPFWTLEHSWENQAVVVLVDNSYSMQANGRTESVETWLAPQLRDLRRPDELGVLLLHPTPSWVAPLSGDLEAGRAALRNLPRSYETSNYRAGLELAAAKLALSTARRKHLVLAGDHQRLGWSRVRFDRTLPAGVVLHIPPPAAEPKRQAAITRLKAARSADGRISIEASVRAFAPDRSRRTLQFWHGDQRLGSETIDLVAGKTHAIAFRAGVPDSTGPLMLRATLDPDDLEVDDTAYAALPQADDHQIILAASPTPRAFDSLAAAIAAVNARASKTGLGGTSASPGDSRLTPFLVLPLPHGQPWSPSTVAILRGTEPFLSSNSPAIDAFLAAGGSAWMICDGSPEQTAWLASHGVTVSRAKRLPNEKLTLRDLSLDHPLFAPFSSHTVTPLLAPVFFRGLSFDGPHVEPLARWPDRGIAIAQVSVGTGTLLLTGFRETREDSTLPTEPVYVPLVHQAIVGLSQTRAAQAGSERVGAPIVLPGRGTWRPVLTPRPMPSSEPPGLVIPTMPGLYAFEMPNAPLRYYAVNLDTTESDLTPWPTPADFQRLVSSEPEPSPRGNPETRTAAVLADESLVDERNAWSWLLVAAIVLLATEVAFANRTIP